MNILVIGGTGFIGDQAVRMLLEQGTSRKSAGPSGTAGRL